VTDENRSTTGSSATGDDKTKTRIGRRRLLKACTALGISGGLGSKYNSLDGLDQITYAVTKPKPGAETSEPRTKEVPAAWHETIELAFQLQENLWQAGLSSLVGSFVVPGSYDGSGASLSIDATDESIMSTIENIAENVAVNLNIIDDIPPESESQTTVSETHQISDVEDKCVPGDVVCKTDGSCGTLAPALFDVESGKRFFATSNHLFGASGTKKTEHRGKPLSIVHDNETSRIGTVEHGYPEADVVKVDPVTEHRPVPENDRASPSRVIGQYTKIGLADLMARGEQLTKLGAFSDRTSGEIKGINGVTCYTGRVCKRGQIKWGDEKTLTDGDSGSVNFHEDPENPNEYIIVGGINNARTWWPGANFTWGTAGYHLLNEYGLTF
jgi:hypothetical protein